MNDHQKAVIIWLDGNIGQADYCPVLKRAFARTVVQEWSRATFLDDMTIETYVRNDFSHDSYSYETVGIDLHAFSTEEDCLQCIEQNKEKRIFFIVSLALGKRIIPQIIKRYPDALEKSNDHRPRSVYALRSNLAITDDVWSMRYSQYMLTFPCGEIDLLKKLINDIARYFMDLGQQKFDFGTHASIRQSLEYFDWAKILLGRVFRDKDAWQCKDTLCNLEKQIAQSETALHNSSVGAEIDQCILYSGTDNKSEAGTSEICERFPLNATSYPAFALPMVDQDHYPMEENVGSSSSVHTKEKSVLQTQEFVGDEQCSAAIALYLQEPSILTENFKNLRALLKHLFSTNLFVISNVQDYLKLSKANDSLIIVQTLSDDDDKQAFEKICSMSISILLYILGAEPDTTDARQEFFTKYPQVCAISNDPRELASKIILDVALKSRTMGDRYARKIDNGRASIMYDQCIGLLNQLHSFALRGMDSIN